MALTLNTNANGAFARPTSNVEGSTVEVFCDLAGDTSYPTGGYPLPPQHWGSQRSCISTCPASAGTSLTITM